MPFAPAFKFNFTAGDLIYGLAPARTQLVIHLGADIINAGGPATVDQYRKRTMEDLSKNDRRAWKQFLLENERHMKYSRYMRAIRSFNKDEESYAASGKSEADLNSIWRAKSKFGMEWTVRNGMGTIHFVLDLIDMAAVTTKTHRFVDNGETLAQDKPRGKPAVGQTKERTITHSELRWLYRNRGIPAVQANTQFWRTTGGHIQCCRPPWTNDTEQTTFPSGRQVSWRTAWGAYLPTTERIAL